MLRGVAKMTHMGLKSIKLYAVGMYVVNYGDKLAASSGFSCEIFVSVGISG